MSALTYPAQAPKVNGTLVTVDKMLKSSKVIQGLIVDKGLHFLSDTVFGAGTTGDSGAVIFSQTTQGTQYAARGDSEVVEPGSEYPMLDMGEDDNQVAVAEKFGAGYIVTDEAKDRNDTNIITRGNTRLRNVVLRQDARRCVAALRKEVGTKEVDPWTTFKAVRASIERAKAQVTSLELGYAIDTILIHPDTYVDVSLMDELLTYRPRENKADNPLYSDSLEGLFGLHWVIDPLVERKEVMLTSGKMVGQNAVEKEFAAKVVREESRDRSIVLAAKRAVPVVTDPLAALILTGLSE